MINNPNKVRNIIAYALLIVIILTLIFLGIINHLREQNILESRMNEGELILAKIADITERDHKLPENVNHAFLTNKWRYYKKNESSFQLDTTPFPRKEILCVLYKAGLSCKWIHQTYNPPEVREIREVPKSIYNRITNSLNNTK